MRRRILSIAIPILLLPLPDRVLAGPSAYELEPGEVTSGLDSPGEVAESTLVVALPGAGRPARRQRSRRSRIKLINDPRNPGSVIAIDIENADEVTTRGMTELLAEELTQAIERATLARERALAAQGEALLRAVAADETAAEAHRLDPGFAAHYPDRDAVWAYVVYEQPNGSSYSGTWRAFLRHSGYRAHGLGVLDSGRGTTYRGEFHEGKPGGSGVLENGWRLYEGNLEAGRPAGVGVETTSTNRVFAGEFAGGTPEGDGVHEQHGETYIGELSAGKRNGFGRVSYADGRMKEGLWRDGRLIVPLRAARRRTAIAIGSLGRRP